MNSVTVRPRPAASVVTLLRRTGLSALLFAGLLLQAAAGEAQEWHGGQGHRSMRLEPSGSGRVGFTRMDPAQTGVVFTNALSDARSTANRNLLSGSGVAAGDVDGDGKCDLYFCGLDSSNVLFRNLGNWKFEDVTAASGVGCAGDDSTAVVLIDVDGDRDVDLLVSGLGTGVRLFRNNGRGRFTEATVESGLASKAGSMSMALADIDGDQDLDLYVANYRPTTVRDRPTTQFRVQQVDGRPVVIAVDGRPVTAPDLTNRFALSPSGEVMEFSEPSDLFLNDGQGKFSRSSFTDGRFLDEDGKALREVPRDWSLSVRFHDFTGDGAPDLYVCNDLFSPDRIWVNDGKGNFRAAPRLAVRHTSSFSMGVDFGDLNRDGHVDFYVVDMVSRDLRNRKVQVAGQSPNFMGPGVGDERLQVFQNTLQISRGDGTFAELACLGGLEASEWSWHPVFLDVDLDGFEDILIPNGMLRDFQNIDLGERVESAVSSRKVQGAELVRMFGEFPGLFLPNLAFRNRGDLTFEEVGQSWGFATVGISQGLALADLDNDGDLDAAVNNFQEVAGVYRNESVAPRLAIRLRGMAPNTQGIGARLRVTGGPVEQSQEIVAGGRYLSSDDPMRVFAAGTNSALNVEVRWRSGRRSVVQVQSNTLCEVEEPNTAPAAPAHVSPEPAWFEDISGKLGHVHHEEPFEDFSRQLLLPKDLSQYGPGVTWTDLDGDGWEDLLVGTGAGGRVAAYRNDGRAGFARMNHPAFQGLLNRDTTTLLGGFVLNGSRVIVAGSSNYEDAQEKGSMVSVFDPASGAVTGPLPGQQSAVGPLSAADIDNDGDLDLFVGGRVVPGHYPAPASSFLFVQDGARLRLDPRNAMRFANLGMVNASVFTDLDQDGDPDLVLAMEWGSLRVFRNDQGTFAEVTESWGLAPLKGWWQSVTAGDFDGDGRMDLVAGNWGWNSPHRPTPEHPGRIYYGDFSGRGQTELLEVVFDPALMRYAPERDLRVMSMALPTLRERFATHKQYAAAGVEEVLGEAGSRAKFLEVTTLASMVFLNRGGRFEVRPLPRESQVSPVFGLAVADADGDGREDVFLGQNFFAVQPLAVRQDAGEGLWLLGDGLGGFKPLPGSVSGVHIYGQQRGVAVSDFDRDGRVDLAVGQNGAATRVFRNVHAQAGLRVVLQGPSGNPLAIGAVLRAGREGQWGPGRELHAGAGFGSQDGAVMVLASPGRPDQVQVRWPGGRQVIAPVPQGATEITVRYE